MHLTHFICTLAKICAKFFYLLDRDHLYAQATTTNANRKIIEDLLV
jgi:hypothetical protein